jgi:hypothetical protein
MKVHTNSTRLSRCVGLQQGKLASGPNYATCHKGVEERRGVGSRILKLALDGSGLSGSRSGYFTARERTPFGHCIGGWVGNRASLNILATREILIAARNLNPGRPIRIPVTTLTQKLTLAQLLNKFPTPYRTRRFIARVTRAER